MKVRRLRMMPVRIVLIEILERLEDLFELAYIACSSVNPAKRLGFPETSHFSESVMTRKWPPPCILQFSQLLQA